MKLVLAFACMGLAAGLPLAVHAQAASSPQQFLEFWGKAWDEHSVESILNLTADECTLVNRFGVISSGKDEIRRSMAWLHNGPFHNAHFDAPKLLDQRKLGPNLLLLHAGWKNPSGRNPHTDDNILLTIVLHDFGPTGWLAEEVDSHAIDPIAEPTPAPSAPAAALK